MTAADPHRYHVHPCDDRAEGHVVTGASDAQDAALIFLEHWAPATEGQVSLLVCDCETGRQECFRLDMASGDVAPCA